jgi:hypothetical protein
VQHAITAALARLRASGKVGEDIERHLRAMHAAPLDLDLVEEATVGGRIHPARSSRADEDEVTSALGSHPLHASIEVSNGRAN